MANWSAGLETNPTYVFAGTGAMYLQLDPTQVITPGTYYQIIEHSREISAYPGQTFTLSAEVRTDGTTLPGTVAGSLFMYFRVEYSDSSFTEYDTGTITNNNTGSWQVLTCSGTVPTPVGKSVIGIGVYIKQGLTVTTSSWTVGASTPFIVHVDNIVLTGPTSGGGGGGGGITYTVATKTASFTAATFGIYLTDSTSGNITATLPAASASANGLISVKKMVSANTVTIVGSGSDTIEGAANLVLSYKGSAPELVSDGTSNWALV